MTRLDQSSQNDNPSTTPVTNQSDTMPASSVQPRSFGEPPLLMHWYIGGGDDFDKIDMIFENVDDG